MTVTPIVTTRLDLVSMSPRFIDSVIAGHRSDAEAIAGLWLPHDWPRERDLRLLRMRLQQMEEDPSAQRWLLRAMVVRVKERRMAGHIGFHGDPEAIGRAELGYAVVPQYRRRGYATEAAQAMMDWAAAEHGVKQFFVSISPDNAPSLAMAARLGFKQAGEQMDDEDGLEYVFEQARP
ncbi:MAG TPA: GNAT family N-acetyltransferase [Dehalococcoidia bacterium]|jgi:RimJ/RimL family protein N-acetyltransferase|nr:GNAT family N-acetyltransferase [Dehalococcoidia bacterium]